MQGGFLLLEELCPFRQLSGSLVGDASGNEKQSPFMEDNFLGSAGVFVNLEDLSRRCIHGSQRRVKTEGDIYAVPNGHKLSLELTRRLAPVDDMGKPRADRPLPEQDSVEGVACHEIPFGSLSDGCNGSLVRDIEDPSAGRHQRIDARNVFVTPRMPRLRDPLDVAWRPDHIVVCHRISACVMEKVGPFVNVFGSRLDSPLPAAVLLCVQRAARSQDTHRFGHRNAAEIFSHYKVYEIVDVRQQLPVEAVGRYRAVEPQLPDVLSRPPHCSRLGVQSVDKVVFAGAKCRSQLAIAAAEVYDETTFDAGKFYNLFGSLVITARLSYHN
ncbi:hypothetical protein ES705_15055 [subsurface metagenome]